MCCTFILAVTKSESDAVFLWLLYMMRVCFSGCSSRTRTWITTSRSRSQATLSPPRSPREATKGLKPTLPSGVSFYSPHRPSLSLISSHPLSSPLVLLVLSFPALECWQRAWQPWRRPAAGLVSARRLHRARLLHFSLKLDVEEALIENTEGDQTVPSRIEEGELFFEMLPKLRAEMLKLQEGRQTT